MTRTVDFAFRVNRNGGELCELYPAAGTAPALRMDDTAEIKTSFSGVFDAQALDANGAPVEVNWLTDELNPEMILDGVAYPLGVYLPATAIPEESNGVATVRVEAYDRCWRVRDTYSERRVYFAAGTNYLDAVTQLLTAAGVAMIVKTPTSVTFPEAREDWELGTSYLQIVNGLLSEISYNPLWFNERGAAVLEPASTPTVVEVDHVLDANNVESLLMDKISRETDIYQAPNVFVGICSNADKDAPLVAKAENTNPQSPLSVLRRGRRILSVERVNNVASQAELQAYVDKKRNDSMMTGEKIRVSTALLPGFGVADVTALHYGDLSAVCIERSWAMELTVGGEMTHTLERVVLNLG